MVERKQSGRHDARVLLRRAWLCFFQLMPMLHKCSAWTKHDATQHSNNPGSISSWGNRSCLADLLYSSHNSPFQTKVHAQIVLYSHQKVLQILQRSQVTTTKTQDCKRISNCNAVKDGMKLYSYRAVFFAVNVNGLEGCATKII